MNDINEIRNAVEAIYAKLNNWASEGSIPLLDKAYPNHDGIADHEAIAEMMMLQQSLNSLSKACELGIGNLSRIIDEYNKNNQ